MRKTVLFYGIIAGIILVASMAFGVVFWQDGIDFKKWEYVGFASMLLAFSTIFFGIKKYRDTMLNGSITFGKAFLAGLYITLIASVMYVAAWIIISTYFVPDFMEHYSEYSVNELIKDGASQEEIDAKRSEMDEYTELYKNPLVNITATFFEIFPIGLIISLIAALILKRKQTPPV